MLEKQTQHRCCVGMGVAVFGTGARGAPVREGLKVNGASYPNDNGGFKR